MILNPQKFHYLVLGNRSNSDTINLNGTKLASSSYEKLLGILIDRDLSFDKHIKSLCRTADQKLNTIARKVIMSHTIQNVFFLIQSLNISSVIVRYYRCLVHVP